MRRTLKLLLGLILALLAAPFVAFAAYDLIAFQPRMSDIRRLLAQAAPEEKAPPDSIRKVVRVSYPEHFIGSLVARLLLQELNAMPTGSGQLRWHLTGAAWWALVELHLSEPERTTLFLALSPMGNYMGFAKASPAVVGVPLSAVSLEQAARLVTVGKAPSHYLSNPELLERRSQALAQRAKDAL